MRSTALVLILTFVFASSALLLPTATAQTTTALEGVICLQGDYSYPQPMGTTQEGYECQSNGQGIPGATVTLTKPGLAGTTVVGAFNQSKTTDESGRFFFSGLESGNYTLRAERLGFETASKTVFVQANPTHRDVILVAKTVQPSGKVADSSGAAVAGAQVQFCCQPDQVTTKTGSDGRFSASVKASWNSISVQAPGFQSWYEYKFIDGSEMPAIQLERVPPTDATIRGTVHDQSGSPVEGARVSASSYGGGCGYDQPQPTSGSPESSTMPACSSRPYYGGENYTFSAADGTYNVGVYSGQGSLSISKEGYAAYSKQITINSGEDRVDNLVLKKFPEKTAHIIGKITDGSKAVRYAMMSVNSPEFGIYECSTDPDAPSGSSGSAAPSGGETVSKSSIAPGSYYNPGCSIKLNADGTFDAMVTPGYAIIQVYVDSYRSCAESQDADGSSSRTCGPEYYSWARTMTLPADATTRIDVALRARPEPDAIVSGYLIDAESGKAIPGATISFNNADTSGYGYATTDKDGSYKLRLRSGYHSIYANAEGHLHWEGTIDIAKGNTPFDVKLTPGQESYGGGCCYAYAAEDGAVKSTSPSSPPNSAPGVGSTTAPSSASGANGQSGTTGQIFEDLGGGLGPYDASKRASELGSSDNGAPAPGLLLALGALAGAAMILRRRKA